MVEHSLERQKNRPTWKEIDWIVYPNVLIEQAFCRPLDVAITLYGFT